MKMGLQIIESIAIALEVKVGFCYRNVILHYVLINMKMHEQLHIYSHRKSAYLCKSIAIASNFKA